MKCQILFFGTNMKIFSKCRLLKILPTVLSLKGNQNIFCFAQNVDNLMAEVHQYNIQGNIQIYSIKQIFKFNA